LKAYIALARSLLKPVSVSVLNQIVSSGANFVLGIYLANRMAPYDFGLYGIGYAISLFYAGIGNALFLTQMVVHFPDKTSDERTPYSARILVAVLLFCLATYAISLIVIIGVGHFSPLFGAYREFGVAVGAASVAYLIKEFFVRHAYSDRSEFSALCVHIVLAVSLISALVACHLANLSMTVGLAIWIYAVAHAIAALYGYALAQLPIRDIRWVALRSDLAEAWTGGKWASLTHLLYFLRIQAHTIVVAGLAGPLGVAKLNAARLFITPAIMLTPALAQVALPRMTQSVRVDLTAFRRQGRSLTTLLITISIVYSALILSFVDTLAPLLIGDAYSSLFWIVAAWSAYACVLGLRNGLEIGLLANKNFYLQTKANIVTALMVLPSVWVLALAMGEIGAVFGLICMEGLLVSIFWMQRSRSSTC
jgi:O-antigen/teichoic acid export membrane protein